MTSLSTRRIASTRRTAGLLIVLAGLVTSLPGAAQQGGSYIGSYSDWEGHVYRIDAVETRCALRAVHPSILEAEIYWVFNTRHADRLPNGFLAIDRRVADGARTLDAVIDGGERFELRVGDDGYGYSRDADAARLFAAMRRGIAMEVTIRRRTAAPQVFPISLIGFTRGSNATRRACAG